MKSTGPNWKPAGLASLPREHAPHPLHGRGLIRFQRIAAVEKSQPAPSAVIMPAPYVYLRPMRADDYRRVIAFWEKRGEPVRLPADSFAGIAAFLQRHPGLSVVAERGDQVLGTVLGSEDGRAGYIQHFVVAPGADEKAVVQVMLRRCLLHFNALGLAFCFLLAEKSTRSVELGLTAPESLNACVAALTG